MASARTIATRCCSPPDSRAGRWSRRAAEPDVAEQHLGLARGHRPRATAGDHLRQHDVFERRELRQQMVELVDEAERAAPQQGAVLVGQAAAIAPLDQHGAAIGPLEQPGDMQQRRFAGARRADQRDDLAGPQREVDAVQHRQLGAALVEHLAHPAQRQHRAAALLADWSRVSTPLSVMAGLDPAMPRVAGTIAAAFR